MGRPKKHYISAVLPIEDGQYYKLGNKYGTLPQLNTINQFGVFLLSLIPINEVVHVKKYIEENRESNIRR